MEVTIHSCNATQLGLGSRLGFLGLGAGASVIEFRYLGLVALGSGIGSPEFIVILQDTWVLGLRA